MLEFANQLRMHIIFAQNGCVAPKMTTARETHPRRAASTFLKPCIIAARSTTSTARQSSGAGGGLNFFTDDTPGLKLSPVSAIRALHSANTSEEYIFSP